MDSRAQIGEFLRSRRARISPEDVGLPSGETLRRVPGLRREEVALLAGVSVDYYIRLERGQTRGVSEGVLVAVGRALQLDETEQAHLIDLARPTLSRTSRRLPRQRVRPGLLRTLELIDAPAIVQGRRMDVLATNRLYDLVFGDFSAMPARERNIARFVFLDERAPEIYVAWEKAATDVVAALRRYSARRPDDPQLAELVGELSVRSDVFRRAWAAAEVKVYTTGTKLIRHPLVGEFTLAYDNLSVGEDPDQALVVYHADRGSRSQEALDLIDSWSLTAASADPSGPSDPAAPAAEPRESPR